MANWEELLINEANKFEIEIKKRQMQRFSQYMEILLEWNKKMNLTRITIPEEIAIKHYADSLTILAKGNIPNNAKMIDVGTGAGFPGIPAKIMREDICLTLLDSLKKRITFLDELLANLKIEAETIHIRAEDAGRSVQFREQFDVVTARAVANISVLAELCLPLAKVGGKFIAMKGKEVESINEKDIEAIGGQIEKIESFTLGNTERNLIIIRKNSQTSAKYPRNAAKIAKSLTD